MDSIELSRLRYERSDKGRASKARRQKKYREGKRIITIIISDHFLATEIDKAAERERCRPSEFLIYLVFKYLAEKR